MRYCKTLTHPQLFDQIPGVGERLKNSLEDQGKALLEDTQPSNQKMTVAIRTLNEAPRLPTLLETIKRQYALGDTQVIVVDNESSDDTPDIARSYGAEVVTLPRADFTYARAMNLCMEAADHPNVFMTVGHAAIASKVALEAGKREMDDVNMGGVYGAFLPGYNASRTERAVALGNILFDKRKLIDKAKMGVMGAISAVFRKDVWEELGGFDERIQNGGEDTKLAEKMLASGLTIVYNPLVTVHHSHGLGPINYLREVRAWTKMARGDTAAFDAEKLKQRRPDLDFTV